MELPREITSIVHRSNVRRVTSTLNSLIVETRNSAWHSAATSDSLRIDPRVRGKLLRPFRSLEVDVPYEEDLETDP